MILLCFVQTPFPPLLAVPLHCDYDIFFCRGAHSWAWYQELGSHIRELGPLNVPFLWVWSREFAIFVSFSHIDRNVLSWALSAQFAIFVSLVQRICHFCELGPLNLPFLWARSREFAIFVSLVRSICHFRERDKENEMNSCRYLNQWTYSYFSVNTSGSNELS